MILSLVAILGAAILFTNAVEILGQRLNLGQGAVGSVLAAVGTALPETVIPLVAFIGAAISGKASAAGDIGIGAILGAPFLLATLALFVVGTAATGYERRRHRGEVVCVDHETAHRDTGFFLLCFAIATAAGIVALPIYLKVPIAIVLIVLYAVYVYRTLKSESGEETEAPGKLMLWPSRSAAPTWAVAGQLILSLAVMAGAAHLFVGAVEHASSALGIPAGLIALVLAPLATELPEKFNSAIWIRSGKDTLALGNITGAMVFQSAIPVSLGLLFTPWHLGFLNIIAVIFTLISGVILFVQLRRRDTLRARRLMFGGALYAVFVVMAVFTILLG